jgi:hypothetical protein
MSESTQTFPETAARPLTRLEEQQDADNDWAMQHYDELLERRVPCFRGSWEHTFQV